MSDPRPGVRDCRFPWTWMYVGLGGQVHCCCIGSQPVGNLKEAPPEEIWNNETMQSLRSTLKAGVIHTVCRSANCKYVAGSRFAGEPGSKTETVPPGFDEVWYVSAYFDVRFGIEQGHWKSGREHYERYGFRERRSVRRAAESQVQASL